MKKSKMKTAVLTMAVLIAAFTLPACGEKKGGNDSGSGTREGERERQGL